MKTYRIQIQEIAVVPDQENKWQSNALSDGRSGYVQTPAGTMRKETVTVYEQTVAGLDLPALVRTINTPTS